MNNFLYYLLIYITIIILRFLKAKFEDKQNYDAIKMAISCSQDIVYTASGCFLSLIIHYSKTDTYWINVVTISFFLVFAVSHALEFLAPKMEKNALVLINVSIILAVIGFTLFVFKYQIPDEHDESKEFSVLISYDDNTLISNIGNSKLFNKHFYFKFESIRAANENKAKLKAIDSFKKIKLVPLFNNTKLDSMKHFTINETEIVCLKK